MTSAISMSGCYSSYASTQTRAADTSKLQQQLFSKVDSNGDQSIDQTELTSYLDYVGEKTGSSIDSASAHRQFSDWRCICATGPCDPPVWPYTTRVAISGDTLRGRPASTWVAKLQVHAEL